MTRTGRCCSPSQELYCTRVSVSPIAHQVAVRGGVVVDGTGRPGQRLDLGIDDGRITAIAPEPVRPRGHRRRRVPGDPGIHRPAHPLRPAGPVGSGVEPVEPARRDIGDRRQLRLLHRPLPAGPPRLDDLRPSSSVEDMRAATLHAGIDWSFETYGEYLDRRRRAGNRHQLRRLRRTHRGAAVGDGRRRVRTRRHSRGDRGDGDRRLGGNRPPAHWGFPATDRPFTAATAAGRCPPRVASMEEIAALWQAVDAHGWGLIHVAPGENFEWVYELQQTISVPVTWSAILAYPAGASSKAPWSGKLERHRAGTAAGARRVSAGHLPAGDLPDLDGRSLELLHGSGFPGGRRR